MFKKIYKYGEREAFKFYRDDTMKTHELKDLFWESTLRCNLGCKHCGSNAKNTCFPDELTTEEIRNVLKKIASERDARKIFLNVTGGEPMMREDLYEVMEYATDELGFRWGMTTNATLINDENIEKLKRANLATVSISIDGLEQTHDRFRGSKGSYRIIIENIRKLQKADFLKHIMITTVFHKDNIGELEPLYREMCELGVDSWRLASVDPIGRAELNDDIMLSGDEIRLLLDFIKKKRKKGLPMSYGCPGYLGFEYENEARDTYFFCRTGYTVASILYNGDIFVCPNVPRHKELIMGNVRRDNFWDVWDNRFEKLRGKNRTNCEECQQCDEWEYCLGGAFHTWDFINNTQKKCTYKMLNGS